MLDMLAPWDVLRRCRKALIPGGVLICYVATTTQLSRMVEALREHGGFAEPAAVGDDDPRLARRGPGGPAGPPDDRAHRLPGHRPPDRRRGRACRRAGAGRPRASRLRTHGRSRAGGRTARRRGWRGRRGMARGASCRRPWPSRSAGCGRALWRRIEPATERQPDCGELEGDQGARPAPWPEGLPTCPRRPEAEPISGAARRLPAIGPADRDHRPVAGPAHWMQSPGHSLAESISSGTRSAGTDDRRPEPAS